MGFDDLLKGKATGLAQDAPTDIQRVAEPFAATDSSIDFENTALVDIRKAVGGLDLGRSAPSSIMSGLDNVVEFRVPEPSRTTDRERSLLREEWTSLLSAAAGVKAELGTLPQLFASMNTAVDGNFAPGAVNRSLEQAFTQGIAIALLESGASFSRGRESTVEKLERACESFVSIVGNESEIDHSSTDTERDALRMTGFVATAEMLFNKAVGNGVSGEGLSSLANCRRDCLEAYEELPIETYQKEKLLELTRTATQAGAEVSVDREQGMISPALLALVKENGIHADTLADYVDGVMAVYNGAGTPEVRSKLPGGKVFQEVERQRARWGNDPFQYGSGEFPQEVAQAVHAYFLKQDGASPEEATDKLQEFALATYQL